MHGLIMSHITWLLFALTRQEMRGMNDVAIAPTLARCMLPCVQLASLQRRGGDYSSRLSEAQGRAEALDRELRRQAELKLQLEEELRAARERCGEGKGGGLEGGVKDRDPW